MRIKPAIQFFIAFEFLATTWAHSQDGVFLRDSSIRPRATMDGLEVVVRYPLVRTTAPRAKGILLVDSESNSHLAYTPKGIVLADAESNTKSECIIHVILDKPLDEKSDLVVVLGDAVFWNVSGSQFREAGWMSLPVEAGQKPAQCLRGSARVFGAEEEYVLDLRLSEEDRAKPAKVQGQLPEKEIAEIRRTVFAMAQRQILEGLAHRSHDGWPDLLREWPGRHALDITVSANRTGAAVYYAPNAGYQMEQIDGKWTIVGG